jgi:hypothetical protein
MRKSPLIVALCLAASVGFVLGGCSGSSSPGPDGSAGAGGGGGADQGGSGGAGGGDAGGSGGGGGAGGAGGGGGTACTSDGECGSGHVCCFTKNGSQSCFVGTSHQVCPGSGGSDASAGGVTCGNMTCPGTDDVCVTPCCGVQGCKAPDPYCQSPGGVPLPKGCTLTGDRQATCICA